VIATALLVVPAFAQTQSDISETQNDLSLPEFRQAFVDLGSYVDARKGTHYAKQFETIPDDILMNMYATVPNPRKLQSAVATLKQHYGEPRPVSQTRSNFRGISPLIVYTNPSCTGSIIDDPPAACNPAYPDPTDGAWQGMVTPLILYTDINGIPTFSPTDFDSVSMQQCGLDAEVVLQQVVVILSGVVSALTPGCSIIPAPFNGFCFGPLIAIAVVDAVFQGYFQDCVEQDGLVNGAKIDAAFHNTVTIYNALNAANTQITGEFTTLGGQLATDTATITGDIGALSTQLTNVNNNINSQFASTDAELLAQFTALTNQVTQSTALMQAYLKAVMRLEMTPDTTKNVIYPILTCTGTNCPNVLQECNPPLADGCSWNKLGPP